MSILNQLSSQMRDRTEYSNRKVVAHCLDNPRLLAEIAQGLKSNDAAIIGDCAEVMTQVAETHPELVVPHAKILAPLLTHKTTRVRWEAMHALSLVASLKPRLIASLLPLLSEMIQHDTSVIVRDYAVDAIANYATTGKQAAQNAYPYLKQALTAFDGKQAGHALNGLANVASALPQLAPELHKIGEYYLNDRRGVVRKAAKKLIQAAE